MSESITSPTYSASIVKGDTTRRRRADTCVMYNPLNGAPRVEFMEQQVTTLPDGKVYIDATDTLSLTVDDPTIAFPLINPVTLQPTGKTMSALDLEVAMVSLYIWLARARDAQA